MSEYYESKYNGEEIDERLDSVSVLGGATTPQEALAALGAGVRPNLLDNAIFIGGGSQQGGGQLPVNQRGQTTGTIDWGYLIDRWKQFGADWQLTPNGVKFSPKSEATYWSVLELLENGNALSGKTLCASVLVDGALFSGNGILPFSIPTFAPERVDVTLSGSTLTYQYYGSNIERTIQAAKLELGSTQTLAYQDEDGNWQLLPQPESDYATQLAKCQRYYQRIKPSIYSRVGYGISADSGTEFILTIPLAQIMRTSPSVSLYGQWGAETTSGSTPLSSVGIFSAPNGVETQLLAVAASNVSGTIRILALSEDAYIDFIAEL